MPLPRSISYLFAGLLCLTLGCHDSAVPSASPKLEQAAQQPITLTPEAKHGAELYGKMCKVCHGANGEGYKADQAPALANQNFLASVTDESMHSSIAEGRHGTTMSAWSTVRGGPLSVADTQALVVFIRSWQTVPKAILDERPLSGDVARGQVIYDRECTRCHGAQGVGGPNIHIGDLAWQQHTSNGLMRYAISAGRAPTAMPAFDKLSPQDIDDLVVLLRSYAIPPVGGGAANPVPSAANPPPLPLGPVPLNPKGPEPEGFKVTPGTTPADVIHAQLLRGARLALLDARAPSDYTQEHIKGAVSVPFYDPSPYLDKLPRDAWLVCYCACPHAESGELATKLVAAGFKKVTVLDEGLGHWKGKNYGTSTGVKP